MSNAILEVENRNAELNPRQLRASGKIPATIYGKNMESKSIQLNVLGLRSALKANEGKEFQLNLNDEKLNAVVKNIQSVSFSDDILNIEFQTVN